ELYSDNLTSLMAKYELENRNNLQGTGMWALGYDGSLLDLWQSIADKLRASWAATFDTSAVPQSWAVNQTRSVTVSVTNVGNSTWPAGSNSPVHLAMHFMTTSASTSWLTDQRFALPSDVAPNQTVTLDVSVTAPPGDAGVLQATMVKEQQLWFKQWANVPVGLQGATWMGSYDVRAIPRTWTYQQTQTFPVTVTNTGNQTWPAGGSSPVRLGLHFARASGLPSAQWLTDQRVTLAEDLDPGQSATISASVTAPAAPGGVVLEAQMVKENQFWFAQAGATSIGTSTVTWLAGYDVSGVPKDWLAGQPQAISIKLMNTGNQAWPATGASPVRLSLHFASAAGQPFSGWLSDQRFTLPADLSPGQSVALIVTVGAPSGDTGGVIEVEAVAEGQFWFSQRAMVSFLAS